MMLLDTHAIVWLVSDQDRLTEKGRELIRGNAGQLYVSVVSAWEISILHKRNRLQLPMEPEKYVDRLLRQHDLNEVPLVREVVQRSVRLPDIHNDPFDRVLIALCQKERWLLLSQRTKLFGNIQAFRLSGESAIGEVKILLRGLCAFAAQYHLPAFLML